MKIGIPLEVWRFMRCTATLMALVLMASPIETATAAQRKDSSKETQDNTEKTEQKKTSLRIAVLVVDPEKIQSPQRVKNATVKIQGEEESYAIGKDGKTQSFAVLPGAKTLVIHVSGVKPCSVDLVVKEGHQDVTVLVEMSPKVKCTLQP